MGALRLSDSRRSNIVSESFPPDRQTSDPIAFGDHSVVGDRFSNQTAQFSLKLLKVFDART
jgi:hypothetical protein